MRFRQGIAIKVIAVVGALTFVLLLSAVGLLRLYIERMDSGQTDTDKAGVQQAGEEERCLPQPADSSAGSAATAADAYRNSPGSNRISAEGGVSSDNGLQEHESIIYDILKSKGGNETQPDQHGGLTGRNRTVE